MIQGAWMNNVPSHRIIILVYLFMANSAVGLERVRRNSGDAPPRYEAADVRVADPGNESHSTVITSASLAETPTELEEKKKLLHPREKRIVYGSTFRDTEDTERSYPVIGYFVIISNSHQCSYRANDLFYHYYLENSIFAVSQATKVESGCVQSQHNPKCGGIMIAPRIVMTACHCLASFWKFNEYKKRIEVSEKDVWEDHNIIFQPGMTSDYVHGLDNTLKEPSLTITATSHFVFSKKYYVHDKCKHIYRRLYSFDFGFVFLSDLFLAIPNYVQKQRNIKVPDPTWSEDPKYYSPLLTEKTMEDVWLGVQRHQSTCLHFGVGYDTWTHGTYLTLPYPMQLKFTWRSIVSYTWCANHIKKVYNLPYAPKSRIWETNFECEEGYRDCATWDCSMTTGRITGVPALGDDGGPVICNDVPYALITGAHANSTVTYISPLVFNYQFSADLRATLINLEGGKQESEGIYIPVNPLTPHPFGAACREIIEPILLIFTVLLQLSVIFD
ncbi:hypothetical protein GE061_002520 [Apolygus lucorum]|uniref:Peptidase S1 domain-containing protein n=1 Tax=Apolygus lucorum TaxID=248454 RepID=A0A8S9X4Z3_APOLU|nr:hypothetical protein GE061_002520 [Apolygus lucorum]